MQGNITVLFIPRESLEDTNKIVVEYGGTPLDCVTLMRPPYNQGRTA
jgi:hypothetical protein